MRATILNISNNILDVCKSHLLVEYIFAGSLDKLDDTVNFKGRTAWLTVDSIGLQEGKKVVKFNLIMLDKEKSDRSNELQIQSDCSQVLIDIAGRLNQLPLNNSWLDLSNATIEPFIEKHNGYLAGATLSFDYVSLEDYNTCDAPFDGSTPTAGGEYIQSVNEFLTCATLSTCPTIITIQENVANKMDTPTGSTTDYLDGTGTPTPFPAIPAAQVNSDWNATSGKAQILNKPNIPTSADFIEDAINNGITNKAPSENAVFDALATKFNNPTGDTTQYVAGDGTLITFPTAGQAGSLVREVRNETGATLTKGTIVYINGAGGNKATVTKAIATSDATSAQTFGFIQADIPNNQNGYAVIRGELSGLDTSAVSGGTQLYLSPTVAGTWTSTKQYAPAHLVYVGIVTRSHQNQGSVEVAIQNGYEIDELHNVSARTPSDKNSLFYNTSNGLWEARAIQNADLPSNGTAGTYLKVITDSKGLVTSGATALIVSDLPTLTKSDVGLGNVDNTSDANKPISTATQTALNNITTLFSSVAQQTTTSTTSVTLTTFTVASSSIPIGGVIRIVGIVERTAGTGSVFGGLNINSAGARYFQAAGQTMQFEILIGKMTSTTVRYGLGPSSTTSASYNVNNLATVSATQDGSGNFVISILGFVGTSGATITLQFIKGNLL